MEADRIRVDKICGGIINHERKSYIVDLKKGTIEVKKDESFVYSTDTSVKLTFEVDTPVETGNVTLLNLEDDSVINRSLVIDDLSASIILGPIVLEHSGRWIAQAIFEAEGLKYTIETVKFVVNSHLLDNRLPSLIEYENINTIVAGLKLLKIEVRTEIDDIIANVKEVAQGKDGEPTSQGQNPLEWIYQRPALSLTLDVLKWS